MKVQESDLTDDQCAEIADWAQNVAFVGPAARIVVDRDRTPGDPIRTDTTLYAHPEDYLVLRRWADKQARWDF